MQLDTLTIVGVGLIGGSIGLAAKARGVARRVLGVGRRQESLRVAIEKGAIDVGFSELSAEALAAELVVFCTPVHMIADQVLEAAKLCKPGTILTDAGSTKSEIISAVGGKLPAHVRFVGSHPLAGSEKKGPEFADAGLFEGRLTVVTPSSSSEAEDVSKVVAFWQALGSRIRLMAPEKHDAALAVTSHVPHLLASALAGALPHNLYDLTATGFRDTTRIAAGDPEIWTGIFMQNRAAVLEALDTLLAQVERFRRAIENGGDAHLTKLLDQAKKVRDALGS